MLLAATDHDKGLIPEKVRQIDLFGVRLVTCLAYGLSSCQDLLWIGQSRIAEQPGFSLMISAVDRLAVRAEVEDAPVRLLS